MPAQRIYRLPLFPLHHVLFPQMPLALRVFEERYRVMIDRCVERTEPFGVVLIREGQEVGAPATPHDVGCVARILTVERSTDGRMKLLAAGAERFRTLDYVEADLPYLIATVENVEDEQEAPEAARPLVEEVSHLFMRYLEILAEGQEVSLAGLSLPEDASALAFSIAGVIGMRTRDRETMLLLQELLGSTDASRRLEVEARLLRTQIETMKSDSDSAGRTEPRPGGQRKRRTIYARPLESEPSAQFKKESRN